MKASNSAGVVILLLSCSLLPVFRSGGKSGLNFWGWIYNHTIFASGPEYVPEEDYKMLLSRTSGKITLLRK